jgi:hypothetical protein
MNYQIIIKRIDTVNEVGYWSDEDFIQLLGNLISTAEKKKFTRVIGNGHIRL